jgi:hypothetical protein
MFVTGKKRRMERISDHISKPSDKGNIMERMNGATYRLQWARSWEDWREQRPFRGHSTWCGWNRLQKRQCCPSATTEPPLVIGTIKMWAKTIVQMSLIIAVVISYRYPISRNCLASGWHFCFCHGLGRESDWLLSVEILSLFFNYLFVYIFQQFH